MNQGKASDVPVTDMLNFYVVVWGHAFVLGNKHNHDATGLKKFEDVSSLGVTYEACWQTI